MSSKNLKRSLAAVAAVAMLAGAVAAPITTADVVKAGEVLGETSFDYKALPWHTCESSPAKQNFEIEGGAFHCMIIKADGAEGSKWDLQVRHRNINLKSGHKYSISFEAKAKRDGMELCSKIGNTKGDEEYVELFADGTIGAGPKMGGQWGAPVKLSTEYKKFEGSFTATMDLEAVEWAFHYANGSANNYGGNAKDGDEIWFDNMSIVCETCGADGPCNADPNNHFGAISRDFSGLEGNYISVNQLGYLPKAKKVAVLGDNAGDINHGASKISVSGGESFKVVDKSGKAVFEGKGSSPIKDKDSGDTVTKFDFSEVTTPGTYHIESGTYKSFDFEIGEDVYNDELTTNAINYFYHNRSGIDIEAKYITSKSGQSTLAHKGGHATDTATIQSKWKNEYKDKTEATSTYKAGTLTANGGWYDAGDHGKYVVNGGISVWTLANMYERTKLNGSNSEKFEDGSGTVVVPETGNKIPDILDECLYELNFMKQMKVDPAKDSVWGKKAAGMIYHKLHDHKWTGLATTPWNYEEEWGTVRIVKPPTFAATLNYAANAAQMARLLNDYDKAAAADWLQEAKDAYAAYKAAYYPAKKGEGNKVKHPDLGCECDAEEINEDSLYAPMWQAKGGGPYGDFDVDDDDYWASCELFITCSVLGDADASKYQTALEEYKAPYIVSTKVTGGENKGGSLTSFNWGNTASAGSLSLALHKDLLGANASKIEESINAAADAYIAKEEEQGYGIPYAYDGDPYNDPNNLDPSIIISGYEWGSNSMVINNAIVMAYAYDQATSAEDQVKYMSGVTGAMDYLLGTNPLSFSFVTGYGEYCAANPHHRYWSNELDASLPKAPEGVLSGGPNAGLQDPYVRALGFVPGKEGNPSQRCYVDSIEAWSTNEVTINWNSPLAWVSSFLADEGAMTKVPSTPGTQPTKPATDPTTPGTDPTTPAGTDGEMLGDVNLDKKVDVTDLSTLALALVENKLPTGQSFKNADVNGDGSVELADLATIRQFISKVITAWPK